MSPPRAPGGGAAPPSVVCVLGQTGAGKTALAVELALALDGEVINCDAMQVYRGLPVATAQATEAERRGVPHHMLGVVDPHERRAHRDERSAGRAPGGDDDAEAPAGPGITARGFRDLALPVVEDVLARGKVPLLVGGSDYYLRAIVTRALLDDDDDDDAPEPPLDDRDPPPRDEATAPPAAAAAALSNSELHERLRSIDPASAAKIHPNNARRVRRYLAICEAADAPASVAFERRAAKMARRSSDADSGVSGAVRFRSLFLALRADHSELDLALGRRVDGMLERGLVEELERHFAAARRDERARRDDAPSGAAQAIGFHEWGAYLRARGLGGEGDGALPPPPSDDDFAVAALRREAVEAMKADTRRLARRQLNRCRRLERSFGWRLTYLDSTAAHAAERVGDAAARRNAWAKDVVEPALEAARAFLAGGGGDGFGGDGAGAAASRAAEWTEHRCEACDRTLRGEAERKAHFEGRRHRKRVAAMRKKRAGGHGARALEAAGEGGGANAGAADG